MKIKQVRAVEVSIPRDAAEVGVAAAQLEHARASRAADKQVPGVSEASRSDAGREHVGGGVGAGGRGGWDVGTGTVQLSESRRRHWWIITSGRCLRAGTAWRWSI